MTWKKLDMGKLVQRNISSLEPATEDQKYYEKGMMIDKAELQTQIKSIVKTLKHKVKIRPFRMNYVTTTSSPKQVLNAAAASMNASVQSSKASMLKSHVGFTH